MTNPVSNPVTNFHIPTISHQTPGELYFKETSKLALRPLSTENENLTVHTYAFEHING